MEGCVRVWGGWSEGEGGSRGGERKAAVSYTAGSHQIKRHGESLLTGGKVLLVESVALLSSAEAGVLPNGPRPHGVHGGVRPPRVRRDAGEGLAVRVDGAKGQVFRGVMGEVLANVLGRWRGVKGRRVSKISGYTEICVSMFPSRVNPKPHLEYPRGNDSPCAPIGTTSPSWESKTSIACPAPGQRHSSSLTAS